MATVPYVRSSDAPDTAYMTFKVVHSSRDGHDANSTVDNDTGESPIARWLAWAFDYSDAVSSGTIIRCGVPAGTIAEMCLARIDTAFVGTGCDTVDIGDDNDWDGWGVNIDFTATGVKFNHDAPYNTGTAVAGSAGPQYYSAVDTIDIRVATADDMSAGQGVLFLKVISYNEAASAEW